MLPLNTGKTSCTSFFDLHIFATLKKGLRTRTSLPERKSVGQGTYKNISSRKEISGSGDIFV